MKPLEGQNVVLTGGAGGIGSLVAQRLRAQGAYVVGVDRVDCDSCDETIIADLSTEVGLRALSATLAARRVDILANVAGVQYFGPVERQDPASLWLGYVVNLIAPATLIRAVLPQMQSRGAGQIVNIGSVLGSIHYPYFATYSSSKAGLHGLSEGLRRELHGMGIAVTHVAPRAVRTAFNNADVNRFMDLTGMTADDPAIVADRIVTAIVRRERDVAIGFRERLFMRLNALLPRIIDAGLSAQTVKARALFPSL
ncbi:MAG: SDR family NAD(P)-dependent oxidoreductase [Pseudomonadota bacterium]|jgi:short-subunit dehydrogenase